MPFFVIKKGLVLLEWKYFPTPKILDPFFINILDKKKESRSIDHTQLVACRRQPCIWSIKGTRQSKTLSRNLILS